MKKYALLAAVIFIATSAGIAAAHWGNANHPINGECPFPENREEVITKKAEALGLDPAEVLAQIEEGKTFREIAEEAGITEEDILEVKKARMEERISQLLADGKITQEEADEKLEWLENWKGKGFHKGGKFKIRLPK